LILDLRHVNKYIWKTGIKLEDICIAMEFIKKKEHITPDLLSKMYDKMF
jgi:hypothetical protein